MKFQQSRVEQIEKLLLGNFKEIRMSHALLSEFVVVLAIDPLLCSYSYTVDMAAQSIERGDGDQRGVDLLVVDRQKKIMMGIDVKLGRNRDKNRLNRNGGEWLDNLTAPFIKLTLGNWSVKVKDKNVDDVKKWLMYCVLPNINEGGKIPGLDSLRCFLVVRIKNSLANQLERLKNNEPMTTNNLLLDRQKRLACKQKLEGLIEIFSTVEREMGNDFVYSNIPSRLAS